MDTGKGNQSESNGYLDQPFGYENKELDKFYRFSFREINRYISPSLLYCLDDYQEVFQVSFLKVWLKIRDGLTFDTNRDACHYLGKAVLRNALNFERDRGVFRKTLQLLVKELRSSHELVQIGDEISLESLIKKVQQQTLEGRLSFSARELPFYNLYCTGMLRNYTEKQIREHIKTSMEIDDANYNAIKHRVIEKLRGL